MKQREFRLEQFDPVADATAVRAAKGAKKSKAHELEDRLAAEIRRCGALGLPHPIGRGFGDDSQFAFASELKRKLTVDFAWPNYRFLVEVQGGIWLPGGGAHSRPMNIERDIEKAQLAAVLGFILIPVSGKDIRSRRAIQLVQIGLERAGWKPRSLAAAGITSGPVEGRTSPAAAVHLDFNDPLP